MKTSPRNIRISTEGLQALKILQQSHPDQSIGGIVSQLLLDAAKKVASAPLLRLNLIDPAESLTVQSLISEIVSQHQALKKDMLKIRPTDKNSAEKIAAVAISAQAEIDALTELRLRVSKMAQATARVTPEDAVMLIEQVAPNYRNHIRNAKEQDFFVRKEKAVLNLIEAVIPDND